MTRRQIFDFSSVEFTQGIAHDGSAPIFFKRATERADGATYNFIDLVIIPVGADIGKHIHAYDNEEIYIIIDGRGMMYLDGNEFEVRPGHVIVNQPGGNHGLKNIGNNELRLVVIEIPLY